jgi:hypothetical protein
MQNVKRLKPVQLTALRLIASGTPDCEVASTLNVSVMSVYRWKKLPAFEAKLNAITSSGLEEIAKKMNATALTAMETLQEVLCDLTQPVPTRMKAALGVLGVMSSVNGALERSLQHRVADFDLAHRFGNHGVTYDAAGQLSPGNGESTITV